MFTLFQWWAHSQSHGYTMQKLFFFKQWFNTVNAAKSFIFLKTMWSPFNTLEPFMFQPKMKLSATLASTQCDIPGPLILLPKHRGHLRCSSAAAAPPSLSSRIWWSKTSASTLQEPAVRADGTLILEIPFSLSVVLMRRKRNET